MASLGTKVPKGLAYRIYLSGLGLGLDVSSI